MVIIPVLPSVRTRVIPIHRAMMVAILTAVVMAMLTVMAFQISALQLFRIFNVLLIRDIRSLFRTFRPVHFYVRLPVLSQPIRKGQAEKRVTKRVGAIPVVMAAALLVVIPGGLLVAAEVVTI